jgi:hypothetical protein
MEVYGGFFLLVHSRPQYRARLCILIVVMGKYGSLILVQVSLLYICALYLISNHLQSPTFTSPGLFSDRFQSGS